MRIRYAPAVVGLACGVPQRLPRHLCLGEIVLFSGNPTGRSMMIPLSCAVHRCTSHGTYLSDLGFRFRFKFRFVLNAMHMYTIKTYITAY